MAHPPNISIFDRKLLSVIARGHPDRTLTVLEGSSHRVSPLNLDEIQIAVKSNDVDTISSIARLIANSYVKTGHQYPSFWRWIFGKRGTSYFWVTPAGEAYLQSEQMTSDSSNKIQTSDGSLTGDLERVKYYLERLGYKMTTNGVAVALMSVVSGYSHCETASHLAVLTLARDAQEAGDHAGKLMALIPHAFTMLELLKKFKSESLVREDIFQNDAQAIVGICTINEHQESFIRKVLSNPVDSKTRVADSLHNYNC